VHPGEDLLDFNEPKKANWGCEVVEEFSQQMGVQNLDTLQRYLTNGFRRKLIFPTILGSISFWEGKG